MDRYKDSVRIMDELASKGVASFFCRSWTEGHFHIWMFFRDWLPVEKVNRFLRRLTVTLDIAAEVFPSGELSGDGPKQKAIALPYFGALGGSWATEGRCQVIEPDTQAPIPMEHFLNHLERNDPPPELPPHRLEAALNFSRKRMEDVETLVDSWPPVGEGEGHTAPNGRFKAGRDDAAIAHAGELAVRGIVGSKALALLERWDSRNTPPLGSRALAAKLRQASHYRSRKGASHAVQEL
jgi:hypothetical protein